VRSPRRGTGSGPARTERVELSRSAEETAALGRRLARDLPVPSVILLRGRLGSGKTTLARGLAAGLGLADTSVVSSPSFTLVNVYSGTCAIYHVDLYRVEGARALESLGLDDFLGRAGVTIVEWAERLDPVPEAALEITLEDAGGDARRIRIAGAARRSAKARRTMKQAAPGPLSRERTRVERTPSAERRPRRVERPRGRA